MTHKRTATERYLAESNARIDAQLAEVNARVAKQLALIMQPAVDGVAKAMEPVFEQLAKQAAEALVVHREPLKRALELYQGIGFKWLPGNWTELRIGQLNHLPSLARRGRVSVVWAPRKDVVLAIIRAKDFGECSEVLVAHRAEILTDVRESLVQSGRTGSTEHADFLLTVRDAVAAACGGHDRAAQAGAAAALTAVVEQVWAFERLADAHKKFVDEDPVRGTVRRFRVGCLWAATADALINTKKSPEGFNRHGTLHAGGKWFNEGDMLRSLLLVAGWARELAWRAEQSTGILQGTERNRS